MKRFGFRLVIFFWGALSALLINIYFHHQYNFQKPSSVEIPGVSTIYAIPTPGMETVTVKRVIDGDTIELVDGRRVRYIGMNTPEITVPGNPSTKDQDKTIECFAHEAKDENKRLVEGKTVRMEKDVSESDTYGRLLRYVYRDGTMINESLVRQGYARVATYPPDVKYVETFRAAEKEARTNRIGLWAGCV